MFLEMVKAEGLAALSYVIGDGENAAVIDPQRDCERYIDIAHRNGARITHIFETHRNEDYIIGSQDLAARTGAEILHGKNFDFHYGRPLAEGDEFAFGQTLKLKVLETPGHTDESISVVAFDTGFNEQQ
ncbi:MAG: MBL fold metallo-hydrolase, partial [Candidatus Competibacteraceae bacterium]|nr:MBL fold metallo-hydrolase [Candidatus Competibacteraceae bacterium]